MSQQVSRDTRAGIAYMLLGIVLLPVMNAIAKSLTADYPLTQVVWARFLGHLIWMALFFGPVLGAALLRASRPREMLGRSFAGAVIMTIIAPWSSRLPDDLTDGLKFAGIGPIGGAAQYSSATRTYRGAGHVVTHVPQACCTTPAHLAAGKRT